MECRVNADEIAHQARQVDATNDEATMLRHITSGDIQISTIALASGRQPHQLNQFLEEQLLALVSSLNPEAELSSFKEFLVQAALDCESCREEAGL